MLTNSITTEKVLSLDTLIKNERKHSKKNNVNKIIKKECKQRNEKIGRPSKDFLYTNERKHVLDKMFNILGLSSTQKHIFMYDLNNNIELQNKILALKDDIHKYFNAGKWTFFSKNTKLPYMSLIRSLFKVMNVKILTVACVIERDGVKITSTGFVLI